MNEKLTIKSEKECGIAFYEDGTWYFEGYPYDMEDVRNLSISHPSKTLEIRLMEKKGALMQKPFEANRVYADEKYPDAICIETAKDKEPIRMPYAEIAFLRIVPYLSDEEAMAANDAYLRTIHEHLRQMGVDPDEELPF